MRCSKGACLRRTRIDRRHIGGWALTVCGAALVGWVLQGRLAPGVPLEVGPEEAIGPAYVPPEPKNAPPEPVSLNSASVDELATLPGIGEVTARDIVRFRTENGPFRSFEDLDAVPGVGPGIMRRIAPYIRL